MNAVRKSMAMIFHGIGNLIDVEDEHKEEKQEEQKQEQGQEQQEEEHAIQYHYHVYEGHYRNEEVYTKAGRKPNSQQLKDTCNCFREAGLLRFGSFIDVGEFYECVHFALIKMADKGLAKRHVVNARAYNAENLFRGSFKDRVWKLSIYCYQNAPDRPQWWSDFIESPMTRSVINVAQ